MWFYYDLAGCGNQTKLLPHVCSQGWRWLATLHKGLGESCCWGSPTRIRAQEWRIQHEVTWLIGSIEQVCLGVRAYWLSHMSGGKYGLPHQTGKDIDQPLHKTIMVTPGSLWIMWFSCKLGTATSYKMWYVIMYCDMVILDHCCMLE